MRSTSGLEGTPPGVFTVTGWDRVPSPFLVSAATCRHGNISNGEDNEDGGDEDEDEDEDVAYLYLVLGIWL